MLNFFTPLTARSLPHPILARISYIHPDGDFRIEYKGISWAAKLLDPADVTVPLKLNQVIRIIGIEDDLILLVEVR